ncbi:MAG: GNAT family N-acetyltransferase [Burkholderiales bacterium PBB5]|nr:MAG: GNAT family N-acetyltransferase [Burkholderiales bacterium PBB5]
MSLPPTTTAAGAATTAARVQRAAARHLDALAPLFDAYRQFYDQPADLPRARRFLEQRLARSESLLWGAWIGDEAVGLCQCYPSFCSVIAQPILVLYDLYVAPGARGQRVGHALMQAAEAEAQTRGCGRIDLTTAHDNHRAQALYTARGWQHDAVFRTYTKTVSPAP